MDEAVERREHGAGRITRPLRFTGQPYSGINILMLWASAAAQRFTVPIWMTFNQAIELARVVAHPFEIFFAGARINDEQIFVDSEAVNDDIVNKRRFRIK